ncbi:MAG: type III secretion system chaperone [Chthoniobacterales bacterium]
MSTPYTDLLEALRSSCNLPEFPDPLPSTQMDLELENGLTISIDLDEETNFVNFFSAIGNYQSEHELDILKKVAEANFLWMATAGSTLSVRPEIKTVYLAYQTPVLSLNGTEFVGCVEKFVKVAAHWQKVVANPLEESIYSEETSSKSMTEELFSPPAPGEPTYFVKA